jgi:hypothetical protein
MDRYYRADNRSRAASAHINTDVFVLFSRRLLFVLSVSGC